MTKIDEPLIESAPLAWRLAPQLCRKDPATGEDCAWYHGIWQYLRLMGLVTTPAQHAAFYGEALGAAASLSPAPLVLVGGAADYCMLAHVVAACRDRKTEPDATVCDVCETPLMLNRWYAQRAGCPIRVRNCDILDCPEEPHFDVICTDSMLGRFSSSRRCQVVAKWRRLLKPGGRVVTVNRIRQHGGAGAFKYSAQQAAALRTSVLERACSLAGIDLDPGELARGAVQYATLREIHPISSLDEIAALFSEAGYALDHLTAASAAAGAQRWSAGSPDAVYAQVVARRL